QYLPDQSHPHHSNYVFAYAITLKNTGKVAAQLISRHWVITDANNRIEEVRGLGVVGHQPLLQPGEQFEYTSGTAIATPQGTMHGEYFCVAEDGERFEAKIEEFMLSLPRTLH
ncbi:MAG: Co2+/Mg2+ efflux protein ApaG, partial [Burkholderiaceae bacterium]|nr:Co2+/Mg2+ efflux protein ApaG [Burkholderiaceae bacterium]